MRPGRKGDPGWCGGCGRPPLGCLAAHRTLDARRGQEARVMRHDGLRAWAGVIGVAVLALVIPTPAPAREQVAAVLHVHSDLTTGDLPLDEVARIAESSGLSAIFLAENYLLRVEYGLPPFRALTRVTKEETSVLGGAGTTQVLDRVAATPRNYPPMLIVPVV